MHTLKQGFRFAARQLWKTPGFSLVVVLTLALGIGATTAIFSLVEGILLRPLPFGDPDRLVVLGDHLGGGGSIAVTAREIATYSEAASAFSSMGSYATASFELSGGALPEEIYAARLNAGVFPTLETSPMLGRVFTKQEEDGHQPLAVISYALWTNRFHRDPQVLGSPVTLDRRTYTVIGVMPRDFEFPVQAGHLEQAQIWVPLSLLPEELADERAGHWGYQMVARLREGVTQQQAANDANRVAEQIMRNFPAQMSTIKIRGDVEALRENTVAEVRPVLRTLFLAVGIVLLIACVNAAGLLLVRAIRRRSEYALRLALGARPSVILRESLIEGLLLSLAGGILGLALAAIAIRTALHLLPDSMPRVDSISINGVVAGFALLLAVLTGALCSLAPAFAALRTNLTDSLRDAAGAGKGSPTHSWLRSTMVVSEIAVALVLLTVSGAFLRSFQKMATVDLGYQPDHVLVAGYQLPLRQYPTSVAAEVFNRAVVDRLSSKPGIVKVGVSNFVPATGGFGQATYTLEGESAETWKLKLATFSRTDGDYFRAMNIQLLEGRYFTGEDNSKGQMVAIVNQSMAKHGWPGQHAIGKRVHVGNPKKGLPWAIVVGVVADTKTGARDEPSDDQLYFSLEQPAILRGADRAEVLPDPASGFLAVRSTLPPGQMTQTVRAAVAEIDPLLALEPVQTMEEAIASVEAPRRFNTELIGAFAATAVFLAIAGIYAVIAFSVSLRTQEIAIRVALGAQRGRIARLVLVSGAKLALLGCGLGVLGSLAVSRLVRSFLFEVSPTDPWIYLVGVLVMLLMALLASALPAVRAAAADPVRALRSV